MFRILGRLALKPVNCLTGGIRTLVKVKGHDPGTDRTDLTKSQSKGRLTATLPALLAGLPIGGRYQQGILLGVIGADWDDGGGLLKR